MQATAAGEAQHASDFRSGLCATAIRRRITAHAPGAECRLANEESIRSSSAFHYHGGFGHARASAVRRSPPRWGMRTQRRALLLLIFEYARGARNDFFEISTRFCLAEHGCRARGAMPCKSMDAPFYSAIARSGRQVRVGSIHLRFFAAYLATCTAAPARPALVMPSRHAPEDIQCEQEKIEEDSAMAEARCGRYEAPMRDDCALYAAPARFSPPRIDYARRAARRARALLRARRWLR